MKLKRLLSALLAFVMVLSLCPVVALAASEPTITWTQEPVDEANGIYKLVGHVQSENGVKMIMTALNYDNTVIQPVDSYDPHGNIDVVEGDTVQPYCVEALLKYTSGRDTLPYSKEFVSHVNGNRTSVELTQYYTGATATMNTDTDYMEFYFKVISGKTVDATTFKFASLASVDPIAIQVQDVNNNSWYHFDDWSQSTNSSRAKLTNYSLKYDGSDAGVVDVNAGGGSDTTIYFKSDVIGDYANGQDAYAMPLNLRHAVQGGNYSHVQYIIPEEFFDYDNPNRTFASQEGGLITKLEFFFAKDVHFHAEGNADKYHGGEGTTQYEAFKQLAAEVKENVKVGNITVRIGTTTKDYYSTTKIDGASSYYIPESELTVVFEGQPYIAPYDNVADGSSGAENDWADVLVIEFNREKYHYTGGNIVVDFVVGADTDNSSLNGHGNVLEHTYKNGAKNTSMDMYFQYRSLQSKYNYVGIGGDVVTKNWLPRARYTFAAADPITLTYDPNETLVTDGNGKTPTITVFDNTKNVTLTAGEHYTLSYSGRNGTEYSSYTAPTAAGDYTVTLTFKNGYTGTKTVDYTVKQGFNVVVEIENQNAVYTGAVIEPVIKVRYKTNQTVLLEEDKDYSVTVNGGEPCEDAGTYSVVITEMNNGAEVDNPATASASFTIVPAANNATVTMEGWTYGAIPNDPVVGSDFGEPVVTYQKSGTGAWTTEKPIDAGNYTVKAAVSADTNWTAAEATDTFTIKAQNVYDGSTFPVNQSYTVNDGSAQNQYILPVSGLDGDHTQTIIPEADLTSIAGKDITSLTFYYGETMAGYGSISNAQMTVKMSTVEKDVFDSSDSFVTDGLTGVFTGEMSKVGNTLILTLDKPYTYTGGNLLIDYVSSATSSGVHFIGVNKGSYQTVANITYGGTMSRSTFVPKMTFGVQAQISSAVDVQIGETTLNCDGTPKAPAVTVTDGTKTLVAGTDYVVTYNGGSAEAPSTAGTHTATLTFMGNYEGSESFTFELVKGTIHPTVSLVGWHVSEEPNTPVVTGGGDGAVTFTYAPANSDVFSETVPSTPGDYIVKATIAETNSYYAATATANFTITDHEYAEAWKSDVSGHWHECECGEKSAVTAHSDLTYKDHKCDTCDYVVSACADGSDANHNCDICNKADVSDHKYVAGTVVAATCTKDGYTVYTCSECYATENRDIVPATDHKDENPADHKCDYCGNSVGEVVDYVFTDLEIAPGKYGIYTATIVYGEGDDTSLSLYVEADQATGEESEIEVFSISNNTLNLCGSKVNGTYKAGTYTVKVIVNPEQNMVTVEVTLPDGGTVRRGTYALANASYDQEYEHYYYYICGYSYEEDDITTVSKAYGDITSNSYTVNDSEPGLLNGGKIYNVVTSFTDARINRLFTWTATYNQDMVVRYKVSGSESDWLVANATNVGAHNNEYFYKAEINGLTPNTPYVYQIGIKDGDNWSAEYSFTTAADGTNAFTFVAIGDTQSHTWSEAKLAQAAIAEAMAYNPAFILHTGDVVESNPSLDHNEWNLYFKALGINGTKVPHFATSGNHDVWKITSGDNYYFGKHFNHPDNGVDLSGVSISGNSSLEVMTDNSEETVYSYDYGDAHFIVLNSGAMDGNNDPNIMEAQRQWLIDDLNANKHAKWTIVMFHQPVYHRYDDSRGYDTATLYNTIESMGVDLVIQGHSHLVTRTYPMDGGKIVTKLNPDSISRGSGTVYVTIGSTTTAHDSMGDSENGNNNAEELAVIATPASDQATYTTVSVSETALTMTIRQLDGLVLDSFTISGSVPAGTSHAVVNDAAVDATCTEDGKTAGSHCSGCGDIIVTQTVIPATGHTYTNKQSVKEYTAAGCENNAVYYVQCDNCDTVSEDMTVVAEGSATGHTYGDAEVTFSEDGTTYTVTVTCSKCDNTVDNHSKTSETMNSTETGSTPGDCKTPGTKTYQAKGEFAGVAYEASKTVDGAKGDHSYVEKAEENYLMSAATCTAKAVYHKSCSICGEAHASDTFESGEALGHKYEAVVTNPTCTEAGYTTYTCSACGDSYVADEVAATDHDYNDGVVTTEPTCTEAGVKTFTCRTCGHSYTEEVDMLGHDYEAEVTAPTCGEAGYTTYTCSACGDSYTANEVAATGHSYGEWYVVTPATCTVNGQERRDCQCGEAETNTITAPGHSMSETIVAPTCEEQGYTLHKCSACTYEYKDTYTAATDHNYVVTESEDATCTENGYKVYTCTNDSTHTYTETIGVIEHTPGDAADCVNAQTCTVCGEVLNAAIGHNYKEVVTDPTCSTGGYTTHTCNNCGDTYVDNEVAALGHNYVNGKCDVCGEADPDAEIFVPDIGNGSGDSITPDDDGTVTFKAGTGTNAPTVIVSKPADGWKVGENIFTVASENDIACVVIVKTADGKYHRQNVVTTDNAARTATHTVTSTLAEGDEIIVAVKGDVSMDGSLDGVDSARAALYFAKKIDLEKLNVVVGDLDGDDVITGVDAARAALAFAKKITVSW